MLLEVSNENEKESGLRDLERTILDLKKIDGVIDTRILTRSTQKAVIALTLSPPPLCTVSREYGLFCLNCAYASSNTEMEWKFLAEDPNEMNRVLEALSRAGVQSKIKQVSPPLSDEILTARQREIIMLAKSVGYFDFPRKKSLSDLAKELRISTSSIGQIMRTAESKIIESYLMGRVPKKDELYKGSSIFDRIVISTDITREVPVKSQQIRT